MAELETFSTDGQTDTLVKVEAHIVEALKNSG